VSNDKNFNKVQVLIVGAGPAGLANAIQLKVLKPQLEVCVLEKGAEPGNHNLSGAVLEKEPLSTLLNAASPGWQKHRHCQRGIGQHNR
jgi:electron-transferring-flavoprotein dehydrogenase